MHRPRLPSPAAVPGPPAHLARPEDATRLGRHPRPHPAPRRAPLPVLRWRGHRGAPHRARHRGRRLARLALPPVPRRHHPRAGPDGPRHNSTAAAHGLPRWSWCWWVASARQRLTSAYSAEPGLGVDPERLRRAGSSSCGHAHGGRFHPFSVAGSALGRASQRGIGAAGGACRAAGGGSARDRRATGPLTTDPAGGPARPGQRGIGAARGRAAARRFLFSPGRAPRRG